jgi:uncharacterized membrane protein YphA (DoxX/SURF4 family)
MALDRQGTGLAVVRICIGVFFLFEGLGKWRWFLDSSSLANQLAGWQHAAAAGSIASRYLSSVAVPGVRMFARLVPLGEISSGLALIFGVWTPIFALLAFLMALNFQVASGALFKYSFLTSGYGFPVLGSTLGLAIGGVRLPWSVRP